MFSRPVWCVAHSGWLIRVCCDMQSALDKQDEARRLGEGAYGQVRIFDSPFYPNTVLKSGRQGHLAREASMMASLCHPNIARVLAKVLPGTTPKDPDQPGYLLLEKLGGNLRQKNSSIDRSALQLSWAPP